MSNSPHPSRSRRLLAAGIYLLVAVVTFTGVFMVGPAMNGSGSQALPDAAAHLSVLRLSTVHDELYAVAVALVCLVAVTLPRGRGFALTFVGAAIAVSANLFHGAVVPIQLIQADMAQPGLDPAQMVALYDRIDNDQWIGASLVPLMLLFPIGMITTALGLWRARLIPLWALGPAVLATLAEFLHVPHAEMLIPLLTPLTSVLIAGALVLRREGELPHEVEHVRQAVPADARS